MCIFRAPGVTYDLSQLLHLNDCSLIAALIGSLISDATSTEEAGCSKLWCEEFDELDEEDVFKKRGVFDEDIDDLVDESESDGEMSSLDKARFMAFAESLANRSKW